ncbi:uncharacterized protein SPAPADRAFT_60990 [Spathaspora passalidarum NRRL Y-27907]|uniref:UspA domain-containing protein n=1 Tax=Spathaspora passalidarum (strain NRRL Y-27907 / 11-Y1) TaxID=619300 RepID=G3AN54_SPAPN|nr:uncharacterized protein SPAPADRAFT_60990 [Spathaspora passalidarum NRRL Y-27907]EGW31897.1 hypothetical protein SPAPADRAFT_60990 [Spathaspora passalidarum NRRL Y-27907]
MVTVKIEPPIEEEASEDGAPLEKKKSMVEVEDETDINTRLNAMLYQTSTDSVELYKLQNNSSDLLGRLYYDDYDSEITSPVSSNLGTPLLAPQPGTSISSDSSGNSSQIRPGISRGRSFERGISFDNTNLETKKQSLILKVKHPDFKFRRNNKTFLTGYNNDYESFKAIEWLFEEMVINGDTIVIFQVLNEKHHDRIDKQIANVNLQKFEKLNMDHHMKKVSIIYEIVIGKAEKNLKKAIDEYSPSMMIVGTHEGKEHKSFMKSSTSKHFLECALVPVIVVKPSYHYVEQLKSPIDSEQYFENWMKSIDAPVTREKPKIRGILSPTHSRNSSYTNLVAEERGRKINTLLVPTRSRSSSKTRDKEPRSRSSSRTRFAKFLLGT